MCFILRSPYSCPFLTAVSWMKHFSRDFANYFSGKTFCIEKTFEKDLGRKSKLLNKLLRNILLDIIAYYMLLSFVLLWLFPGSVFVRLMTSSTCSFKKPFEFIKLCCLSFLFLLAEWAKCFLVHKLRRYLTQLYFHTIWLVQTSKLCFGQQRKRNLSNLHHTDRASVPYEKAFFILNIKICASNVSNDKKDDLLQLLFI